jgi:hypothetical protein
VSAEQASSLVKLLFDENLSPGLVSRLTDLFPKSVHVHECGLGESSDNAIWELAAREDFTIVEGLGLSRSGSFTDWETKSDLAAHRELLN